MAYTSGLIFGGESTILESLNFAKLFTYVIDFIAKISVSEANRDKCMYLASRYYLEGIACRNSDTSRNIAQRNAGITDIKENTYQFTIKDPEAFKELKNFITLIRDTFKIVPVGYTDTIIVADTPMDNADNIDYTIIGNNLDSPSKKIELTSIK